ncbi:MAG: TolC family protein [Pseudomonadota bacterium]
MEAARNAIQAERARLFATEQTVLLNGATAYLDTVQNQALVRLNMENERVLGRQLEATNDQFRVGEVTRTDVAQAEARLAGATASRIQAEGTLETSRATFQQVIGIAALKLIRPPRPTGLPTTSENAAAEAAVRNPTVVASQFDEGTARSQIDVARGGLLPTLSLSGTAGYTRDTAGSTLPPTGTATLLAQLSVPLYESGSVYSQVPSGAPDRLAAPDPDLGCAPHGDQQRHPGFRDLAEFTGPHRIPGLPGPGRRGRARGGPPGGLGGLAHHPRYPERRAGAVEFPGIARAGDP